MNDKILAASSYAGGIASVLSALTLTDIGILVGVITALLTFAMNAFYQARKDRREQQAHEIRIERLLADRRQLDLPVPIERRTPRDDCPEACPYVEE